MTTTKKPPSSVRPQIWAPAKPRIRRSQLRDDIVGGAFVVTFFLLVASLTLTFLWQRNVFQTAALDRVAGVAAVQEARVIEYIETGLNHADVLATRGRISDSLSVNGSAAEPEAVEAIERALTSYTDVASDLVWASVYTSDLTLVATTASQPISIPNEYLTGALKGSAVGMVVPGAEGATLHLVAVRIGPEDKPLGVAVVAQSGEKLERMAADYTGLGVTGETVLAQPWGNGGAEFIVPLGFDRGATLNTRIPGSDKNVPVIRTMAAGSFLSNNSVDYRGSQVFASGRFIESTGWALVIKIDRDEAMAPLDGFTRIGLIWLLVGSAIAGLAAWYLARHIRKPILEMKDAAVAVARGERDIIVPNGRVDEIGDLADAFNVMTVELNGLTGSLERQVEERTAELEVRNHEMSQLIADKETFLAGLSHEVRGPLTAMMGFLDLAGDDLLDESIERGPLFDAAMQQADEVLILIEDLLAAARAESGTLKMASVRVNLEAQIAQVLEGLPPDQQKSIEVRSTEALATGDPARTRQIIRNLAANALRYGGPLVRIRAFTNQDEVVVLVEDNGSSIPEADRENIFNAYGQSSSRRQVSGSVGIGLHVSRQLAELMSGHLGYEYSDGWSIFALHLPVFRGD